MSNPALNSKPRTNRQQKAGPGMPRSTHKPEGIRSTDMGIVLKVNNHRTSNKTGGAVITEIFVVKIVTSVEAVTNRVDLVRNMSIGSMDRSNHATSEITVGDNIAISDRKGMTIEKGADMKGVINNIVLNHCQLSGNCHPLPQMLRQKITLWI